MIEHLAYNENVMRIGFGGLAFVNAIYLVADDFGVRLNNSHLNWTWSVLCLIVRLLISFTALYYLLPPVLMVFLKSVSLICVLNFNDWKFFEIGWLNLILCWVSTAAINLIYIPSVLLTGFAMFICKILCNCKMISLNEFFRDLFGEFLHNYWIFILGRNFGPNQRGSYSQ